jgi:hypothetical protein
MSDEERRYDEETITVNTSSGNELKLVLGSKDGVVRRITIGDGKYIHLDAFKNLIIEQKVKTTTIAHQREQVLQYERNLETANTRIGELSQLLEERGSIEQRALDLSKQCEELQPDADLVARLNDVERREADVATQDAMLIQKREDIQAQLKERHNSVERECASRIRDADIFMTSAKARQQKLDAAYSAAAETLNNLKGYIRSLTMINNDILKSVKEDLAYCKEFMDKARHAYGAEGAALIFVPLYSSRLKLNPGEADILLGLDLAQTAGLKALAMDARTKEFTGYHDTVKAYYIKPVFSNTTKIAHFCLTGIPTEGTDVPAELSDMISNTASYLSDHLSRDYITLQLTEWESSITKQSLMLEQQIAALKP